MGLFSSKTKTYVSTSVNRLIEDNLVPNSTKSGILKAVLKDTDLGKTIQMELENSIAVRTDKMFRLGRDKYAYGIPTGEYRYSSLGIEPTLDVLSTLEGQEVIPVYFRYGEANYFHFATMWLLENGIYDIYTRKVVHSYYNPILGSTRVIDGYVIGADLLFPENYPENPSLGEVERIGLNVLGFNEEITEETDEEESNALKIASVLNMRNYLKNDFEFNTAPGITEPTVSIIYQYENPQFEEDSISSGSGESNENNPKPQPPRYLKDSFYVQMPPLDKIKDYIQVAYTTVAEPNKVRFWTYEVGSGVYPQLDEIANEPPAEEILGTFYPRVYFRRDKVPVNKDTHLDAYNTGSKVVKAIGIEYDEILDSIHENPDIDDIEQAYLTLGVPINSSNQTDLKYLYEFYDAIHKAGVFVPINEGGTIQRKTGTVSGGLFSSALLNLFNRYLTPNTANKFGLPVINFSMKDAYFTSSLKCTGVYKRRVIGSIGKIGEYSSSIGRYEEFEQIETDPKLVWLRDFINSSKKLNGLSIRIRKQISSRVYEEIQIDNPTSTQNIRGSHYTNASLEEDIENLLIPIDRNIAKNFPLNKREELHSRGLHFVFNSFVQVKVKWYQQGWFKSILQIAAIAITIISFGSSGYLTALASATTASAVGAVILSIVMDMVIGFFIMQVGMFVLQSIDPQLLAILSIVITVATLTYGYIQTGSPKGMPWAEHALKASSVLNKAAENNMKELYKELAGEYEDFMDELKLAEENLETAKDLLYNNNYLSPYTLIGETPQEFYTRTVHAGNIGAHTLKAVNTYVDRALKLPTIDDTLGGTANA